MTIIVFPRLIKHLEKISAESAKVLIFVGTKRVADELTKYLRQDGWPALAIHGDKQQQERDWVMNEFKTGRSPILIATDVASRGLGKLPGSPVVDSLSRLPPRPCVVLLVVCTCTWSFFSFPGLRRRVLGANAPCAACETTTSTGRPMSRQNRLSWQSAAGSIQTFCSGFAQGTIFGAQWARLATERVVDYAPVAGVSGYSQFEHLSRVLLSMMVRPKKRQRVSDVRVCAGEP
jgi:hypothetical protein